MSAATTLSAAWASATATARPIGEATLAEAAALVEGCIAGGAGDDDDDDDAAAAVGSLRVEKLWFDTSCTLLLGLSREDTNEVDDDDVESFLALLLRVIHREIEDLPLPDRSHDVVVMSQALHYATSPSNALAEAHRILVPGGKLLLLDLLAHGEEWVRDKLQHVHLGFTEEALASSVATAGFDHVAVHRAARDPQPPHFMTLVATGLKS